MVKLVIISSRETESSNASAAKLPTVPIVPNIAPAALPITGMKEAAAPATSNPVLMFLNIVLPLVSVLAAASPAKIYSLVLPCCSARLSTD
jgi:hypothetical protein